MRQQERDPKYWLRLMCNIWDGVNDALTELGSGKRELHLDTEHAQTEFKRAVEAMNKKVAEVRQRLGEPS